MAQVTEIAAALSKYGAYGQKMQFFKNLLLYRSEIP